MRGSLWVLAALTFIESSQSSCAPRQFITVTIFETPAAYVRLEADPTVDREKAYTHPRSLGNEIMAAALRGVIVHEPVGRMAFYDDISQPRRHPAFTGKEVDFFAPLLTMALSKATPEEIVTFYLSRTLSGVGREVTSGGVFVQGDELHIILANYRSPTHFSADTVVADTTDDRLTPLRALAPQRGKLDFEPGVAKREATTDWFSTWFHLDPREVVILYPLLPPRPQEQRPVP